MGNKHRVPTADAVRNAGRTVAVEDGATAGAIVGRNLVLEDGTVVSAAMILNIFNAQDQNPYSNTIWRLIGEKPPNIVSVAALVGGGFAFMDSIGNWRVRRLGRQVFPFAFGDASPAIIYTAPHDLLVVTARAVVRTAFNGTGAALSLGTVALPASLLPPAAVTLAVAGSYEFTPDLDILSGVGIQITITPGSGASAGAGKLFLDTIPLEGI